MIKLNNNVQVKLGQGLITKRFSQLVTYCLKINLKNIFTVIFQKEKLHI